MESVYDRMEQCIAAVIDAASAKEIDPIKTQRLIIDLENCQQAIRKTAIDIAFNAGCNNKIELYIQQWQCRLVRLAETLNAAYPSKVKSGKSFKNTTTILQLASTTLEDCLTFLETNFPQYISMREKLPPGYKALLQRDLQIKIAAVQQVLVQLELDATFIDTIVGPTLDRLTTQDNELTYHDAWYLKRLYCSMEQDINRWTKQNAFQNLYELLISLNYNLPVFTKYLADHMSIQINDATTRTEQLQILSWYYKHFSQMFQTQATAFREHMTGARESLLLWVQVEMNYVEKMEQLTLIMPPVKDAFEQADQIETDLTVHVFACLVRILSEKNIIRSASKNELLRQLSQTFRTNKAEPIAYHSLRNKFYSIEAKTAVYVRSLLLDLVSEVRKFE